MLFSDLLMTLRSWHKLNPEASGFSTCFLLEQERRRESTGKASRMQFLPSHWEGSLLWDWRSEKSFKRLNAGQADGFASLIYRCLSQILTLLNLSACCDTPLPSEHQQLCFGWIHTWSKKPQLTVLERARSTSTICQGWGQQEHLWTNGDFVILVTKLLLTCTKGLAHFKIYPFLAAVFQQ